MTDYERLELWRFEEVHRLSEKASVVRNVFSGKLMLYHISSKENFPVMRDVSAISHKNLMRVFDVILDGEKCCSLCEYIDGMTLEQSVEQFGVYGEEAAKQIMIQVCDALSRLHSGGIIHRDVNPSNVMIDRSGTVKLIDYDITREEKPDAVQDTHILGTVGYASPEQFGFAQTDGRADVYSCGVLLNYLLTGCLPNEKLFEGKLSGVIVQCTQIDREKRFDSAEQLSEILKGSRFSKERRFKPLPGFRGKNPIPKVLMTLLFTVYFLFLAVYVWNMITRGNSGFSSRESLPESLLRFFILFGCWSFLPYMFFGDMFNLSYHISPKNRYSGRRITIALGIAAIILGFILTRLV